MKKFITLLILLLTFSCHKVEPEVQPWTFEYDQNEICNYEWVGTYIQSNDRWMEINNLPELYHFTIRFKEDYTYQSTGLIYNGTGTYEVKNNIIYTYVHDLFYVKYIFDSFVGDTAEITIMTFDGFSFKVKVKRM